MPFILPILFGLIALIYASVGFGGGSSYTALLTLFKLPAKLIPVISLLCNVVVVSGGSWRFWRGGHVGWRKFLPLMLVSVPLAFIGGLVPLKEASFYSILGLTLLLSALALFVPVDQLPQKNLPQPAILGLSGIVGLLAGLSGIGGGIFMAPVLHLIRWAEARQIAAFASLYILANSIAGLSGQILKNGVSAISGPLGSYWPLLVAVLVGGQLGSHLGLKLFSPIWLRRMTALLVGYAALRLLWQAFGML